MRDRFPFISLYLLYYLYYVGQERLKSAFVCDSDMKNIKHKNAWKRLKTNDTISRWYTMVYNTLFFYIKSVLPLHRPLWATVFLFGCKPVFACSLVFRRDTLPGKEDKTEEEAVVRCTLERLWFGWLNVDEDCNVGLSLSFSKSVWWGGASIHGLLHCDLPSFIS